MSAPYAAGDEISIQYENDSGIVEGPVRIRWVTKLTDGRYRLMCERPGSVEFPDVHVLVDQAGREVEP